MHLVKAMHLEHGGKPYFGRFRHAAMCSGNSKHIAPSMPCATPPYFSVHIRTRPYPALHTVSAMRNVLCQPVGMCYAHGGRNAHGARGETLLFPRVPPFRPWVIGWPAARDADL